MRRIAGRKWAADRAEMTRPPYVSLFSDSLLAAVQHVNAGGLQHFSETDEREPD